MYACGRATIHSLPFLSLSLPPSPSPSPSLTQSMCMRLCTRACVHVCVRACVNVCARACARSTHTHGDEHASPAPLTRARTHARALTQAHAQIQTLSHTGATSPLVEMICNVEGPVPMANNHNTPASTHTHTHTQERESPGGKQRGGERGRDGGRGSACMFRHTAAEQRRLCKRQSCRVHVLAVCLPRNL